MAESYGPFDGLAWAQDGWFGAAPVWAPSGVLGAPAASAGTGALPLTINGLTVTLGAGSAWVRGAGYKNDSKAFTVAANTNSSLSRRDRIVLRRDLAAKTVTAIRQQGTPASSPVSPSLTQSDTGQWDLPLFSFLVPPNSGTTLTDVLDERASLPLDGSAAPIYVSPRARDTAVPSPVKGQRCATTDDRLWRYDGTAWRYVGGGVAPDKPISLGGGVSAKSGFDPMRSWKDASGTVHASGVVDVVAFNAPAAFGTLDVEHRPAVATERMVYAGESRTPQRCSIGTDGVITVRPTQSWVATYWVLSLDFLPKATDPGQA